MCSHPLLDCSSYSSPLVHLLLAQWGLCCTLMFQAPPPTSLRICSSFFLNWDTLPPDTGLVNSLTSFRSLLKFYLLWEGRPAHSTWWYRLPSLLPWRAQTYIYIYIYIKFSITFCHLSIIYIIWTSLLEYKLHEDWYLCFIYSYILSPQSSAWHKGDMQYIFAEQMNGSPKDGPLPLPISLTRTSAYLFNWESL